MWQRGEVWETSVHGARFNILWCKMQEEVRSDEEWNTSTHNNFCAHYGEINTHLVSFPLLQENKLSPAAIDLFLCLRSNLLWKNSSWNAILQHVKRSGLDVHADYGRSAYVITRKLGNVITRQLAHVITRQFKWRRRCRGAWGTTSWSAAAGQVNSCQETGHVNDGRNSWNGMHSEQMPRRLGYGRQAKNNSRSQ